MADSRVTPEQPSPAAAADAHSTPPTTTPADAAELASSGAKAAGVPDEGDLAHASPHAAGQEAAAAPADAAALAAAQARVAEYHEAYLRAKAEMENIRRRAQDDIAKTHKYAIEGFAEGLVPVIDSLEAALASQEATAEQMRSGVEITLRQLLSAFEKSRLVAVEPWGERFDPNRHQAISMVPSPEVPAQHVVAVLQKGWMIADRVLRPAMVTVSNGAGS